MNREYKSDVFSLLMQKPEYALDVYHCVVFYNGVEKQPARQVLKLSDSYCHSVECPDLELTCVMININATFNDELLAACSVLKGYMIFVDKVRKYLKFMNHDEAIERGIDECIEEDVLKDFFTVHRQEVLKVAMLDYTFERQIELEKRDSYAEGRTEERSRGIRAMYNGLTKIGVSTDQALNSICEEYHITLDEVKKYLEISE